MNDYAIVAQGLTKRFGTFTAVDRVDLQVPRGQIFGFLGPNGCGKTTTIRMLCGIMRPSEGTGRLLGYDIILEPERVKENIGYLSQGVSIYQDLTTAENIDFFGATYGVVGHRLQERKKELLEMFQLTGQENRLAAHLPAGSRQRLALACTIIHHPRLLLLDEPTAGLDPVSRRNFWDLLYRFADEGITILVTTHHMDEAEHCDNVGLMHQGRFIAFGSPETLKERLAKASLEDAFFSLIQDGEKTGP